MTAGVLGPGRIEKPRRIPYIGRRCTMVRTGFRTQVKTPHDSLTPAMRQYMEQKASAPDALLLFRMGDFYETFHEDAKTAARVLGIALTSRGKDRHGEDIPLAGIPYHALESYLTKLVRAGYKVAISEQVEDPKTAKGVVKREITRIVTPGTLTDDALLEGSANNYLACVHRVGEDTGVAFVELSTGAFWVQAISPAELLDELVKLSPAELLLQELPIDAADPFARLVSELSEIRAAGGALAVARRPARLFDPYQAERALLNHFGVASLEGFGFDRLDASLCAAAAIIDYLTETQRTSLSHIVSLRRRYSHDFVWLDQSTWRSLEIERTMRGGGSVGSLVRAVDRTSSPMGARCLRRWLAAPLRDPEAIRRRQDAIADLLDDPPQLEAARQEFRQLADIERITARLGVGRASPRDLVCLGRTLLAVERVADLLDALEERKRSRLIPEPSVPEPAERVAGAERGGLLAAFLAERRDALRGQRDLAEFLVTSLHPDAPLSVNEGGIIASGFDEELDRLRAIGADGQQWLAEFQAREIERSGIPSLKVGFNQVFGYYIEITNTHRDRVPANYVRKQTLKNAERYITDELKAYETEVLTARDRANAREAELFGQIRTHAIQHIAALQALAVAAAEIDVAAGFAHLSDTRRYVRADLVEGCVLDITDGRHPVLEQTLDEKFVPNNCSLNGGYWVRQEVRDSQERKPETLMILTGPNMAGKSTYIRQVALLTLLAQTAGYVPAAAMRLSPVDRVFARVGASDEITRGQSTFMVEMTEAANILNNATDRSLVIIDELGRGTSTFDGLSLAWAIAEQLVSRIRCRGLFATHYHELTDLERYLEGAVNYNVAVREWQDEVVFLHRIVRGGTDKSYGVHVAKLAGVPREVIARSQELLAELESDFSGSTRAPKRAARRTRRDDRQMLLFTDPAEDVVKEIRATDANTISPIEALKKLEEWRKRLGP